jgi:hypothetical protein
LPEDAYLGTYANAYLGRAVIADDHGALILRLGPQGQIAFPLTHYDRDLFISSSDEGAEVPSAVSFRIGPDRKASQVTIEALDDLGLGTLTRVPP